MERFKYINIISFFTISYFSYEVLPLCLRYCQVNKLFLENLLLNIYFQERGDLQSEKLMAIFGGKEVKVSIIKVPQSTIFYNKGNIIS